MYDLKVFAPFYGTNTRCLATRARALGWKPKKTTEDMLAGIKTEVETLLSTKKIDSLRAV